MRKRQGRGRKGEGEGERDGQRKSECVVYLFWYASFSSICFSQFQNVVGVKKKIQENAHFPLGPLSCSTCRNMNEDKAYMIENYRAFLYSMSSTLPYKSCYHFHSLIGATSGPLKSGLRNIYKVFTLHLL